MGFCALQLLRYLGDNPTSTELQDLIIWVDADGNGVIDYDEFITLVRKENGNATALTTLSLTLHSLPLSNQIVIRSRHKHTEQQLIDAFKVTLTLCLELCSFDSRYPHLPLQMFDDSGTGFLSIKRLQHAMKHLIDMDETRVRGTQAQNTLTTHYN